MEMMRFVTDGHGCVGERWRGHDFLGFGGELSAGKAVLTYMRVQKS